MSVKIKLRRDTAANWASVNPVLALGEPGLDTTSGKIKYGDGTTVWNSLSYYPVSYNDLTNKPTIPTVPTTVSSFTNDAGYSTFSGAYADLTGKPTIPTVPVNVSDFTNDAGYLTSFTETDPVFVASVAYNISLTNTSNWNTAYGWGNHATAGYASVTYVDQSISQLVNGAPAALNTLNELSAALGDDANYASTITLALSAKANTADLASIATSGSYLDLTNVPTFFSGSYLDLTNAPTLFSGAYADLTGKPTLFSGSYTDLTNKPTLFSGDYSDLSNKPAIPGFTSQLFNDSGFTTFSGAYADLTGKPTLFSGDYADLTNKPTLFSGAYADLTGLPTIPTVPTTVSSFTNDAGYLTSFTETDPVFVASVAYNIDSTDTGNWNTAYGWGNHATAGYASVTYVDQAVADLVASAPAALNTLNELATALGSDANFSTTISNQIGLKVNSADLGTAAYTPSTDYATASQGGKADTAVQPADIVNMLQTSDIGISVQAYNANTVIDSLYVHTDNNYTTAEQTKLNGIADGAEVNVNADWNATSGDAEILNKPVLATVATSGSYNDLSNLPSLFNGSYLSLTDTPVLFDGDYNSLTNTPALFSGSYLDLTNKPTLFSGSYLDLTNKPTLFSGAYADLTGLPTIPTVPTNVSSFTNDSGYLVSSDLTSYATKTYVDTAVSDLVASAPTTLNTLNELAAALGNDANYATTITTALGLKANTSSLATVATSGSYNDLSDKPTIPSLTGYATESYVTTAVAAVTATSLGLGNVTNESKATMFTSPSFTGTTTFQLTSDSLTTKTGATGTVAHDISSGTVFYHSSISANFTANFTNAPTTNDKTIGIVLVLEQGATAYIPNAVSIDGTSQTIKWMNGSAPTGNASKVDIVSFTLIRTGSAWTVLGNLTTFG